MHNWYKRDKIVANSLKFQRNKISPFGAENPGKAVANDCDGVAVVRADALVATGKGTEEPKENNGAIGALFPSAK